MSPVLRTSLVAALLAGTLAAGGCSSAPPSGCPPGASECPARLPPRVTFITTINGRTAARPVVGPLPVFQLRAGQPLTMRVAVTVPRHVRLTALWVGICKDSWGFGPGDRPSGMNPILTSFRQPLSAGVHTFGLLRWRFPEGHSGGSLYLCMAWLSQQPPAGVAGAVAVLTLR